ncbi:MAG: glycosyltransferase family A protein, partial [Candidatus Bipolaricaulota bacterium]
ISVLIPTLDRYPYLETLLGQLEKQTLPPHEVIVVDQTEVSRRRTDLAERFTGLNLRWLTRDEPGQCSARNAGIENSRGEWLLFLDDDDEIPEDYCQRMILLAGSMATDSLSGVVYTPGEDPPECWLQSHEPKTCCSSVFPTNTTILRKDFLHKTGGFDLRYDRGQVEDADLGMRLHLSGALMILDEGNCILHHHAPRGGLRAHGARVITRAAAKRSLWKRNLPSAWDFYLALRYFGPEAAREVAALAVLQSFSTGGGGARRALRVFVCLVQLPSTLLSVRKARRAGERLALQGPRIPLVGAGSALGGPPDSKKCLIDAWRR